MEERDLEANYCNMSSSSNRAVYGNAGSSDHHDQDSHRYNSYTSHSWKQSLVLWLGLFRQLFIALLQVLTSKLPAPITAAAAGGRRKLQHQHQPISQPIPQSIPQPTAPSLSSSTTTTTTTLTPPTLELPEPHPPINPETQPLLPIKNATPRFLLLPHPPLSLPERIAKPEEPAPTPTPPPPPPPLPPRRQSRKSKPAAILDLAAALLLLLLVLLVLLLPAGQGLKLAVELGVAALGEEEQEVEAGDLVPLAGGGGRLLLLLVEGLQLGDVAGKGVGIARADAEQGAGLVDVAGLRELVGGDGGGRGQGALLQQQDLGPRQQRRGLGVGHLRVRLQLLYDGLEGPVGC